MFVFRDIPDSTVTRLVKRLGVSAVGSYSVSVASFLTSAALIPVLPPSEYGFFAFILVLVHFGITITNATVATPLSVLLNQNRPDRWALYHVLRKVNFLSSCGFFAIVLLAGWWFTADRWAMLLMACYAFLFSVRWFARSLEYALSQPKHAIVADLIYSAVLIGAVATLGLSGRLDLATISGALVLGAGGSLAYLMLAGSKAPKPDGPVRLHPYREIWSSQAGWSLVGVTSTEMTVNGHAYLVLLVAGPQGFAPLAVAMLCWRPVTSLFPSLTLLERPVMARQLANNNVTGAWRSVRDFRLLALTVILANLVGLVAAWYLFQDQIEALPYTQSDLVLAVSLWFVTIVIRSFRLAESAFIQAARRFRELAWQGVYAFPVSLGGVALLLAMFDPIISLIGIIAGEIALAVGIRILTRKVLNDAAA